MNIYGIYFSPTGGTEKIVTHLAKEFGDPRKWDLSKREETAPPAFTPEDICVIGVCGQPTVPGNFPYREYNGVPLKPKTGSRLMSGQV